MFQHAKTPLGIVQNFVKVFTHRNGFTHPNIRNGKFDESENGQAQRAFYDYLIEEGWSVSHGFGYKSQIATLYKNNGLLKRSHCRFYQQKKPQFSIYFTLSLIHIEYNTRDTTMPEYAIDKENELRPITTILHLGKKADDDEPGLEDLIKNSGLKNRTIELLLNQTIPAIGAKKKH